MKKKWVDEQGEPWPPAEAVCGTWKPSWLNKPTWVQPERLSEDGTMFEAHSISVPNDDYGLYTPFCCDFTPGNDFTKQVIGSWNAEWANRVVRAAHSGDLAARINRLGVNSSTMSVDSLSDIQQLQLIELIELAESTINLDSKAFEMLVLKVFKEKK